MGLIVDLVHQTTNTTGTGTLTLGPAVTGFRTFAGAGIADGTIVSYGIQNGTNREVGWGIVGGSGTTLTRNLIASTTGSLLNLSGSSVVGGVANSGDFTLADDAVTYAKIQNVTANSILARAAATDGDVGAIALAASQLFGRGATGDLAPIVLGTNLSMSGTTLNAAAGGIGKQTIFVPASSMLPRITNGPSIGSLETATNRVNVSTLDFDPTTQEFAQFQVAMPKSWDEGTVTYEVIWYHPATTVNFGVVWSLAGVALSDTNALDTAFGTAVQVTDTGGTTNALYDSPESGAVTIGNTPAENDYVVFQIARVPADGSDTMAVDARLLGIRLFYTTNAGNDA
jgi:hypothetical protein